MMWRPDCGKWQCKSCQDFWEPTGKDDGKASSPIESAYALLQVAVDDGQAIDAMVMFNAAYDKLEGIEKANWARRKKAWIRARIEKN